MRRVVVTALVSLGLMAVAGLAMAQTTPPTVSILSPDPGVTIATSTVDVVVSYEAAAGSQIARVELVVDGVVAQKIPLDPPQDTGTVTLTWDAASYRDGDHQVVVRAVDTKGKTTKSRLPVSLRRGMPEPQTLPRIAKPAAGAAVSGVTSFEVELSTAQVKYVIFLVDNVFKAMSNIRPFIYSWDTTRYLNGSHQLQAKAYLGDGTEVLSQSIEVQVDNPSGMTTMRVPAAVAPRSQPPLARTPAPSLPPAIRTESPTPYSKSVEVKEAEFGPPGTAPYVSESGDLVQPPTAPLAARTETTPPLKAAALPAPAAAQPTAPQAAAASVETPPQPSTALPAAPTEATPPLKVAALPAPAAVQPTAPEAVAASIETPPQPAAGVPAPEATPTAVRPLSVLALPPAPLPQSALPEPAPAAVITPPQPAGSPTAAVAAEPTAVPAPPRAVPSDVRSPAAAPVAPLAPPAPAAATSAPVPAATPAPAGARAEAAPSAPAASPKQIAMLPPKLAEVKVSPKVVAQPAVTETLYVVQVGDSLSSIAARHGLTVQHLAKANGLKESDAVRVGQQVRLPAAIIYVDGTPLRSDVPVAVADGRAMAPFRAVIEKTGGTIAWEPKTHQAMANAQGRNIAITVGSDTATVDGKATAMGASAVISGNRTLVPLRFLGQALDLTLEYRNRVAHAAEAK